MTGTASSKVWTKETIDKLKELWNQGLSAEQISREIPGTTRNAVIGKKHRLGLEKRKQPPSQNPIRIREKKERIQKMPVFKPAPLPPAPPNGKGIPFMKATASTCRSVEGYEIDENGHNLAMFCPNQAGVDSSFCAFHQNIYYRKD